MIHETVLPSPTASAVECLAVCTSVPVTTDNIEPDAGYIDDEEFKRAA